MISRLTGTDHEVLNAQRTADSATENFEGKQLIIFEPEETNESGRMRAGKKQDAFFLIYARFRRSYLNQLRIWCNPTS